MNLLAAAGSTETFATYNNRARLFPSPKGWGNVGELARAVSRLSPHPSDTGIGRLLDTENEGTSYARFLPRFRSCASGRRQP